MSNTRGATSEQYIVPPPWVERLFNLVDTFAADEWAEMLTDEVYLRVGAGEPIIGKEAARDAVVEFAAKLDLERHNFRNVWEIGDTVICEMLVEYKLKGDDELLSSPTVTILRRNDEGKVYDYRVHADYTPLGAKGAFN